MSPEPQAWHALERGRGRPLVLLHGIGMAHTAWAPVIDRLAAERRVIAFDIPGFGRSQPLPPERSPTQPELARALAAELDRRELDQPVDIAGNSLGGHIALELAVLGRSRSVVALSPSGLWAGDPPLHPKLALWGTRFMTVYGAGLLRSTLRFGPVRTAAFRVPVAAHGSRIPVSAALEAASNFASAPAFAAVMKAGIVGFRDGDKVDVPVTVAFGERDLIFPSAGTRRRDLLPAHTRWLSLSGCGHVPMWDDPDLVARTILKGTQG